MTSNTLKKVDQKQISGSCARCTYFAGDEWDNTFRMLFQHHPFCPYIELIGINKQDFIKSYLNIEKQLIERIREELRAETEDSVKVSINFDEKTLENLQKLPSQIIESLKKIEESFESASLKNRMVKGIFLDDEDVELGMDPNFINDSIKQSFDADFLKSRTTPAPDEIKPMGKYRGEICRIISEMLDNPDQHGIYPTTKCFEAFDELIESIEKPKTEMVKVCFDPNKEAREKIRAEAERFSNDKWGGTSPALVDLISQFFITHVDQFRPKYITKDESDTAPLFVGIDRARDEKLIEEKPDLAMDPALRQHMLDEIYEEEKSYPFMNFVGETDKYECSECGSALVDGVCNVFDCRKEKKPIPHCQNCHFEDEKLIKYCFECFEKQIPKDSRRFG